MTRSPDQSDNASSSSDPGLLGSKDSGPQVPIMFEIGSGAFVILSDNSFAVKNGARITIRVSEGVEQDIGFCTI